MVGYDIDFKACNQSTELTLLSFLEFNFCLMPLYTNTSTSTCRLSLFSEDSFLLLLVKSTDNILYIKIIFRQFI